MKYAKFGPAGMTLAFIVASQSGCVVPQAPGHGNVMHRVEPQTKTGYWLYLPEDYVAKNGQRPDHQRWPLVVTFHGMKPWDNAKPQISEWQQEADRYNFIVIAPELCTCDSFMQFPLKDPTLPYVQHDEKAALAIMDEVFRQTNADPSRVLVTSWSSGGYMAHYMVNRYPERFSCLAVRQSNFSEDMLNSSQVPRYRNMKVGIFFGENDFKICRDESIRAVEWYRQFRFPYVQAKYVSGLGHERTPQTAAAFFASTIGATPKTPPDLGTLVMRDIPAEELSAMSHRPHEPRTPPAASSSGGSNASLADRRPPEHGVLFNADTPEPALRPPTRVPPSEPVRRAPATTRIPPSAVETPKRPVPRQPYDAGELPPRSEKRNAPASVPPREQKQPKPLSAKIRVHGDTTGSAPMWVSLSVDFPEKLKEGASILWTDNDRPIAASNFDAQSMLREPGDHAIEARITTADDRKIVLRQNVKVLAQPASQPAAS